MGYQFGVYFHFAMGHSICISLFFRIVCFFFTQSNQIAYRLIGKELKINKQTLILTVNTSIFSDGIDTSNPDETLFSSSSINLIGRSIERTQNTLGCHTFESTRMGLLEALKRCPSFVIVLQSEAQK